MSKPHKSREITPLHSAVGNVEFPPLPEKVKKAIPNGIVVFYEDNRTSVSRDTNHMVNSWVIETSGSFRSERLFVLAEVSASNPEEVKFTGLQKSMQDWAMRTLGRVRKSSSRGTIPDNRSKFSIFGIYCAIRHFFPQPILLWPLSTSKNSRRLNRSGHLFWIPSR